MSHASVPAGAAPPPEPELVRLSIGLEDADELFEDLVRALASGGPTRASAALAGAR